MRLRFAIPVFLGSALLFCVQPMLGRALLPLFGGTASVWTVCLVAYQALLVAGSVYADRMGRKGGRGRRVAHVALLAVSCLWTLAFARFRPGLALLVPDGGDATREMGAALLCVLAAIGLPYVILSAGSSLVQKWAEESLGEGRETYRLYVVSNIGSFAGLLAYPLAIEPFVPQTWQWRGFAIGIALYASLCAAAGIRLRQVGSQKSKVERPAANPESPIPNPANSDAQSEAGRHSISHLLSAAHAPRAALWLALPALSTAILDATTTHLSSDVSPFPLMWVVLLGLFLLSYAIGFSRLGERLLPLWFVLAAASAVYAVSVMGAASEQVSFARNFAAGCLVILFGGCFLHGWLCRLRPEGGQLTRFYLCIALGGAAGGLLGGMAPVFLFDTVAEYPVGLFLLVCALVAAPFLLWREPIARAARFFRPDLSVPVWKPALGAALALLAAGAVIRSRCGSKFPLVHERGRTFYGTWAVARDLFVVHEGVEPGMRPPTFPATVLVNGNTTHGLEAEAAVWRGQPTTYYGEKAGGLAFSLHPKYSDTNMPLRVALVGMGAGTQAWYGRPGDVLRFFEIDGAMVAAARRHFSFLRKSRAEVEVVVADARKALEREDRAGAPRYDVLVVDAYSGDSVPLHLMTAEAFDLYASRLAPDGLLALHITNWNVDLLPVAKAAAARLALRALGVGAPGDGLFRWDADWVFLSRAELEAPKGVVVYDWADVRDTPLPTDDRGSILPYLRRFAAGEPSNR